MEGSGAGWMSEGDETRLADGEDEGLVEWSKVEMVEGDAAPLEMSCARRKISSLSSAAMVASSDDKTISAGGEGTRQ